jgi:hypothetical protein
MKIILKNSHGNKDKEQDSDEEAGHAQAGKGRRFS